MSEIVVHNKKEEGRDLHLSLKTTVKFLHLVKENFVALAVDAIDWEGKREQLKAWSTRIQFHHPCH